MARARANVLPSGHGRDPGFRDGCRTRSIALATSCAAFVAVPNLGALFGRGERRSGGRETSRRTGWPLTGAYVTNPAWSLAAPAAATSGWGLLTTALSPARPRSVRLAAAAGAAAITTGLAISRRATSRTMDG
ncbi:hypothetical protein [Cryptosporangium sp. NPDC048952]|uniref:hypothetical protein n=1 Tax=Cryptosporangium sp. NPDC048952 TaxID=3363961 RepID=UPI00371C8DC6